MHKKIYQNIKLTCVFQKKTEQEERAVVAGLLSANTDGSILFQETLPRRKDIRNSRLYEGRYVSIVRRKDGRYYPLLKAIRPEAMTDKEGLAYRIFVEIMEAFSSVE